MKKTSATMESQPFGQRDTSSSSSSSGSSKQSFYTQAPESPISVAYSTFLNNDRYNNDPGTETSEFETETRVYTPSQRLSSPTSPHKWHPSTNPGLSNNRNYRPTYSQQGEREASFFPYTHDDDYEASCLCLSPLLVRAVLNVANGIQNVPTSVIKYISIGANWAPPIPPESESESDPQFERGREGGLERRGRRERRGGRKWKGPPPPIFVPMGVFPVFRAKDVEEQERGQEGEVPLRRLGDGIGAIGEKAAGRHRGLEDEGSDDDALDRGGRSRKKWKGKGKAVDVGRSSREFLGSGPVDPGKLRRGSYVPAQPDTRGTRWVPRGGHDLGEEEGYYHPM